MEQVNQNCGICSTIHVQVHNGKNQIPTSTREGIHTENGVHVCDIVNLARYPEEKTSTANIKHVNRNEWQARTQGVVHTVKYNPGTEISCSRAHNGQRNRLDPTIHSTVCKNWELTPRGCIVTWNVEALISNLVLIRFRYTLCRPPAFRFTFGAETFDRSPVQCRAHFWEI